MSAKIESWLVVQSGARITADGHLRVRTTAGPGAWISVTLTAGTYKTFDLAVAELAAALNADAAAIGAWSASAPLDVAGFGTVAQSFDWEWLDLETATYFGFSDIQGTSTLLLGITWAAISDIDSTGKVTLAHPMDVDYTIVLPHRHTEDHAARRFGTDYTIRHGQDCRFIVNDNEEGAFVGCLKRLTQGYPARIWLDATLSGTFDWTNADWKKGRDLALVDPAADLDLTNWLAADVAYYRRLELRMVEAG